MPGTLFIIAAPSGAGKTSLVNALLDTMSDIVVSISHTTRAIRPGEQEGVNYFFVFEDEFNDKIKADEFLEYANVFGFQYGTSREFVESQLQQGNDVILEIDWQGAQQVRKLMPEAVSIFILPPSMAVLHERLLARQQDSEAVIQKRLAEAKHEMAHFSEFDYVIINDDFVQATEDLQTIIKAQRMSLTCQRHNQRMLLEELVGKG